MGYTKRNRAGMGDTISTLVGTATDPYLSEVICRVGQLRSIENHQTPGPCATTAPNLGGGVGLRKVMPAMRAYVYAEQHPWVYPAAVAGVIGLPLLIGYFLAKGSS